MSRLLLDTHVVLWALQGNDQLSERVLALLNDPEQTIYVSPVSAYEIALKTNLGKLPSLPKPFLELVQEADFAVLPIHTEHYELAGRLPLINLDPWDRMLSAQAIEERMSLVSRDSTIARLGAKIIW